MVITVSVSLSSAPVSFDARDLINHGVSSLDAKEFDIFNRYFVEQCTLKEVGVVYGVGKTRMHQIVKEIRLKVQRKIGRF